MRKIKEKFESIRQATELNQRLIFGIIMIFAFGLPVLIGGAAFVFLLIVIAVFATSEYTSISQKPSLALLLCIAVIFFLVYILRTSNTGLQKIILLTFIVIVFDTSAYFIGKAIGKHKLCPRISPGKTIEGLIGGILAVMLLSTPLHYILSVKISLIYYAILVGIIAFVSQMGDILESSFKRKHNVKDSSNLIPGHGGVLDRFDGYILSVPLFSFLDIFINFF